MGRQEEGSWPAWGSPGRSSSWPAALLAASVLSSCFLLTQAVDIPVMMKPSRPLRRKTITLTPGGNPNFILCSWYRDEHAETHRILMYLPSVSEQQNGPAYSGRESSGPGCYLQIKKLQENDTGIYIVTKVVTGGSEKGSVPIIFPERHNLGKGAIVGIVIGTLAGIGLIGVVIYYAFRHWGQKGN